MKEEIIKVDINTETISINDISDVSFNAVSTTINQPLTWDISNQVWDASTTISVDTINEKTNNNGVVIEGVTVKNNGVTAGSNGTISATNFNFCAAICRQVCLTNWCWARIHHLVNQII